MTKAERTRAFIIEKSAHLFNRKGYSGTSMSDILEATGLAKGGVYGHFDSKEQIALAAFGYASAHVLNDLATRIKAQEDTRGKLIAIINYYYNFTKRSPIEGGCPVMNYSTHMGELIPELKLAIAQVVNRMLESIIMIVEKGKKYKQVKANVNARQFAEIFYSRIDGAVLLAKASGDDDSLNRMLDDLKQYIEDHILS
jgi:TetR/AcrR family transcriptional repressor of nem operon